MADIRRMEPTDRRRQLLEVALELAVERGYRRVTRCDLAEAAGCSPGLVNAYFVTMGELRDKTMRAAVRRGILPVVAEGLAEGHIDALAAPLELRKRAAEYLVREEL